MGIQKDTGELLAYIYKKYTSSDAGYFSINYVDLLIETKWDGGQLFRAITYLSQRNLIKSIGSSSIISIEGILPDGIDIVENTSKFKHIFGFKLDFKVFKFSWTLKQK